jgi:hypothetical protein
MPTDRPTSLRIDAPISIGELIDKITILEIKGERIAGRDKAANVGKELALLRAIKTNARLDSAAIDGFARELRDVNAVLWDIEDEIRELEVRQDFGARFVELARAVYLNNDRRSRIKQRINAAFGSDIVEEKSYKGANGSTAPGAT